MVRNTSFSYGNHSGHHNTDLKERIHTNGQHEKHKCHLSTCVLESNSKRVSTMYIFELEVFVEGDDVASI